MGKQQFSLNHPSRFATSTTHLFYIFDGKSVDAHHSLEQRLPNVSYETVGSRLRRSLSRSEWALVPPLIFTLYKIQGHKMDSKSPMLLFSSVSCHDPLCCQHLRDFLCRATACSQNLIENLPAWKTVLRRLWQNDAAKNTASE